MPLLINLDGDLVFSAVGVHMNQRNLLWEHLCAVSLRNYSPFAAMQPYQNDIPFSPHPQLSTPRNRGTRWLIPSRTHLQLMAPTRPHTACHQLWHPALARHQCTAPLLRAMAAWPGPTEVTLEIAESPGHVQTPPPHQQLSPACLTPRARLQEGPPPAARPPHGGSQTQIAL